MSSLRNLLSQYQDSAGSEREKDSYFQRLAVDFIKNDHGVAQEYEDAWLFSEWAAAHCMDGRDTGIDAVAKTHDDDSFCAFQCKFYREGQRIQKADIDSFFTASGSCIVNDTDRYAIETVGYPAYALRLFQRVITVSLETTKIVKAMPPLGHLS